MKFINKFALLSLVMVMSFSACNDDFLTKTPLDQGSVEGFFETSEDVVRAINGIYDVFQGSIWGGAFYWYVQNFDILTDNGVGCCPWEGQYSTIAEGTHNSGTGGIINQKWDFGYEGIFRANSVLENIGNVGLDGATETLYIAEVRFLRGLIYQELTNLFGDVPLVTKVLTREEGLEATRAPKSEVLAQIYSDLDFAEANLGTSPTNGDIGRPTKQSAIAVKARLKMYNEDWSGAAAEAKKIMDMSASNPDMIGLLDNYAEVFSPDNENNKEVLFDIQYTEGTQGEGNFMQVALAPGPEGAPGNGWGSITPTDQLVAAFEMTDGLPADESPLYDPENPYANRDQRLYDNLFVPGISMWRGKVFDASLAGFSPYFAVRKWVDLDATIGENGCACNETNTILFRYADVLMIYAESMNEANGPSAEAIDALNQVRTRSGMPAIEGDLSKDELREIIHHERHVEFPWEGLRYRDLIRWGKAADVVTTVTLFGESLDDRQFDPSKHGLWPIPQKEIDLNPNLTQNPGY